MANNEAIAAAEDLAAGQYGVVSRAQVLDLGVTRGQVDYLLRRDRWGVVHRGVYRPEGMGPATERGHLLSAVMSAQLAVGPSAVAAAETAARLWGIRGLPPWRGGVVLASSGRTSTLAGSTITLRPWRLAPDEVEHRGLGVRVTSAQRTLRDLMMVTDRETAVSLIDSALNQQLVRGEHLIRLVDANNRRRGALRRRAWWALTDGRAESPLESRVRLRCHDAGVPPDELQVPCYDNTGRLIGFVDFLWRDAKIVAECDGREPHERPEALYRDRRRQNDLAQAFPGWRILRFTWSDLYDPDYIPTMILRAHQ